MRRFSWFNATSLTLGFAFLYLPMLILIIYSFNESRLVTVWAGFSTKWYGELFQNEAFLGAAWVTIKVAFWSSTFATILGTMAAYVMVRAGRFRGRGLFSGMIYAPLVMPEVITGLSLLLFFISIEPLINPILEWVAFRWNPMIDGLDGWVFTTGWFSDQDWRFIDFLEVKDRFERGILTIILGHTTFAMCYVSVVVTSRLVTFDQSLEEAALDLGCTPFDAFRSVTLPIIMPAVISGWLLAFTLSLDDLVIATFTSGPSSTTLPIKIFSAVRLGVTPEINALSTVMILLVTIGVITASLISRGVAIKAKADERKAQQG